MTTNEQAPFPAEWVMKRFGPCCLHEAGNCGFPKMELRPCANRSNNGCNKGCHHLCAEGVGLAPDDGSSGKFWCSKACMDSTNTNNNNNTANATNNPNSTTTFRTMEEAFDPANNPVVADAINRKEELEANQTPPPTPPPKPPSDSPAEEIRDEDMNLYERRKRFGPQGATHFQRGVNRRHDEGHLGGSHGRQAGMAYYDEILPKEGEEVDMKADGLKCAACGKDCPRKVNICPGCKWSMHATCGILGLYDPRYRYCGGCLTEVSKEDAAKLAKRDPATKKALVDAGVIPKPLPKKRKTQNTSTGGGSSGRSKRSSGSSKRRRTGASGSASGRGNNNNNVTGTIGNDNGSTGNDNNNNNNNSDNATGAVGNNSNTTTNNSGRKVIANPITTEQMRDGIVDDEVYSRYVNEIIHFTRWLNNKHPDWLTDHYKEKHNQAEAVVEGEKPKARQARIKALHMQLVKNSHNNNIINIDKLEPTVIMEHLAEQANQNTGKKLSVSGYAGKRSAIRHLFRCQQGQNWSEAFASKLEIYWKGFMRVSNPKDGKPKKRRKRKSANTQGDNQANNETQQQENNNNNSDSESESDWDSEDDREEFRQGKTPMSPELYRNVLQWFLEWGTQEGIFCACYICLTWHLACRTNNTARVKFSHMLWTYFDAMHLHFRHTKTQQHGQAKRHKRAIYSNPFVYYMDSPLLLGLYLSTNFNTTQRTGNRLFPGGANAQSKRVGDALRKVLKQHEQEVLQMGYDTTEEIGLHSMRKGISSYLASLPGGPPPAALCLRAGWSMGKVKDIYFHQTQGGDEFVGRCAAMLNLMNGEFATSPAYFKSTIDQAVKKEAIDQMFPQFTDCAGMERILEQCLASMVHHRDSIMSLIPNHAARSVPLYRQEELLSKLKDHVVISNAWDPNGKEFTGIPPHIKSLVDIAGIKREQSKIVEDVFNKVMKGMSEYFDEKEIGGGQLTESRIRNMISQSLEQPLKNLGEQTSKISATNVTTTTTATAAAGTTTGSTRRMANLQTLLPRFHKHHDGRSRLPENFQWPRQGILDLWYKWNVEDTTRKIPPLRLLQAEDYGFLDKMEKTDHEKRGSTGKHKDKRRKASKTYSDMKFVCKCIEEQARVLGMDPSDRSVNNVNRIYREVSPAIFDSIRLRAGERTTQLKWITVHHRLRKKVKEDREARDAAARAASTAAAAALVGEGDNDDDGSYLTDNSRGGR